MALPNILHCESFGSPNFLARYTNLDGANFLQSGRGTSPQGWALRGLNNGQICFDVGTMLVPTAPADTFGVAFAHHNANEWGRSGATSPMFKFYEGATGVTLHISLSITPTGLVQVVRGDGTVLATGTVVTPINSYFHVEAQVKVHDSTGFVKVKVNEVLDINLTGADTRNGGAAGLIGHFRTWLLNVKLMTDLIIHDANAGDWIGDVRVAYHEANAAGTYSDGTASSGTKLSCVDDPPGFSGSGDADYVAIDDASIPDAISMNTANLPSNVASVIAVAPLATIRKDDAGTNLGRLLLISGATEVDGGADVAAPSSYTIVGRLYQTDPNTSAAWTVANANLHEVGWRRTA